jgi:shikimate dehydrogenase
VRCAVLGDPVDHSLSPVIHRAAYRALGLDDWRYDAVQVPSGGLAAFLEGLDPAEWRGLSLTMPLKREAVPLLGSYDEWVRATGVCNTVLLDPDGSRHGLNTDVTGALMVLGEHDVPVQRAVVLGGGATATSLLLALAERGMRQATLVVRDPDRAAARRCRT